MFVTFSAFRLMVGLGFLFVLLALTVNVIVSLRHLEFLFQAFDDVPAVPEPREFVGDRHVLQMGLCFVQPLDQLLALGLGAGVAQILADALAELGYLGDLIL